MNVFVILNSNKLELNIHNNSMYMVRFQIIYSVNVDSLAFVQGCIRNHLYKTKVLVLMSTSLCPLNDTK